MESCIAYLQRLYTPELRDNEEISCICVNMSYYFFDKKNYSQAEYCLLAAKHALPKDDLKYRKTYAYVLMNLGNYQ